MSSQKLKRLTILWIGLLLASCASRVPPNGGSKDTTAPQLIASVPEKGTTNFRGNKVSLSFDEFIELKDGGSGIVISPPMAVPPKVILKGKTVQISFVEALDSNTTYTLTIGKSVTDITEGNAFPETGFAFSTGSNLDSLKLSGNVFDAYSNQPVKDALVMLYNVLNDSLPYKKLPRYFSRTNETGRYLIQNVKQGIYLAVALTDVNANYLLDQPGERIGFQQEPIQIDSSNAAPLNFRIAEESQTRQRLLKKDFSLPGKLTLKYAMALEQQNLKSRSGETIDQYSEFKTGDDSLIVWIPNSKTDSLTLISSTVSAGISRVDTLLFSPGILRRKLNVRTTRNKSDTLLVFTNTLEGGKLRPGQPFVFIPNHPGNLTHPERIFWVIGKDTIAVTEKGSADSTVFQLPFKVPVFSSEKAEIVAMPGAFSDVFGMENDTTKSSFSLYVEDDLGLLDLRILTVQDTVPLILEITDPKGKRLFIRNVTPNEPMVFEGLVPGKYGARLITDTNKDGKWTTGKFLNRKPAETMRYYSGEINIRAGWDLELEWNIDVTREPKTAQ